MSINKITDNKERANMVKRNFIEKNYLKCNSMITKGMTKRRRLAISSIYNICENAQPLRLVK